jgi:hypothetical protein
VAQNTLRERKLLLKQMQSLDFIADLNDGQGVRKHEFVLAVLSHLGVLNKERDVDPWMKVGTDKFCFCADLTRFAFRLRNLRTSMQTTAAS